ncbi:MAG: YkvA family protein [Bacteroidota bacterium]|nr:YkvA family protein [Bacteroidota bacterium]
MNVPSYQNVVAVNYSMMMMRSPIQNPLAIFSLLRKKTKQLSAPLLYTSLLLYHALRRKETPSWAKRIILGGFVYLFVPIDAIPDVAPIIGYTDDLGVMLYAIVMVVAYINQDVREAALKTLHSWIGPVDGAVLKKVNDLL